MALGRRPLAPSLLLAVAAAAGAAPGGAPVEWTDARSLGVAQRGFDPAYCAGYYDRLPADAKGVVRDEVWALRCGHGVCGWPVMRRASEQEATPCVLHSTLSLSVRVLTAHCSPLALRLPHVVGRGHA